MLDLSLGDLTVVFVLTKPSLIAAVFPLKSVSNTVLLSANPYIPSFLNWLVEYSFLVLVFLIPDIKDDSVPLKGRFLALTGVL